jgi:hypothetical protein
MHPTDLLSQEHRAIEAKLNLLEQELRGGVFRSAIERAFFEEALDFFRNSRIAAYVKEENLLFPFAPGARHAGARWSDRGYAGGA